MLDGDVVSLTGAPEEAPADGKVKVRLVCPLYQIVECEADKVLLPGEAGDILILPERAPIFVGLRAGRMVIYKGTEQVSYFISRGIAEVRRNLCPVLAWGIKESDVDLKMIAAQLKEAEDSMQTRKTSDLQRHEVVTRIEFFKTILDLMNYNSEEATVKKAEQFSPYQLKSK